MWSGGPGRRDDLRAVEQRIGPADARCVRFIPVNHTCHQCGQDIEEGAPFCRNCGAPQIRIPGTEEAAPPPQPPPASSFPPGTPGEVQPPAQPVAIAAPVSALDWSHALPAAGWAGALLAVAWLIPYLGYFLWIIGAGVIAVAFYRRRVPGAMLKPADGARIGAVCGLFGFAGFAALMAIGLLLLRGSTKFREMLQQSMQQAAARNPDPNAQQVLAWMTSPAGLALMVTIVMVIFLIGFIALSSAGGAIGAKLFRGKSE